MPSGVATAQSAAPLLHLYDERVGQVLAAQEAPEPREAAQPLGHLVGPEDEKVVAPQVPQRVPRAGSGRGAT